MNKILYRVIQLLFPLVALALLLAVAMPHFAFAEAPFLVTETAIPIDKASYRIEGGLQYDKASTNITSLSASLRYGLINNLEVAATLPYLFASNGTKSRNQFGDIFLAAKVRFIKGREANPLSIGGTMQVKVPFGSQNNLVGTTGEADVGFSVLASKQIPPYEAHLNLGYTFMGGNQPDRLHYAFGLDYKEFRPNLSLMGELFGTANDSGASHDNWSGALGASTFVRSDIRLDGALGLGLSHHAPDYILSLRSSYFFD
jgi:hypothetical protein